MALTRSRSRSAARKGVGGLGRNTKATKASKVNGEAKAGREAPRKRDYIKAKVKVFGVRLKTMRMEELAFVSAVLHFACLAFSFHGIFVSSRPGEEKDGQLIMAGFAAYFWDVMVAVLCGRIYFYKWTRQDVFQHHLPFMFVGGLWALKTFKVGGEGRGWGERQSTYPIASPFRSILTSLSDPGRLLMPREHQPLSAGHPMGHALVHE